MNPLHSLAFDSHNFQARALLLAERLDVRALHNGDLLATAPTTLRVPGGGVAVLFRHGVVVLFNVSLMEEAAYLEKIRPAIALPYARPEIEEIEIHIDPQHPEWLEGTILHLDQADLVSLQVVADVLSKTVLLSLYEDGIAADFDRIEPLARELGSRGRLPGQSQDLLKTIGTLLLTEHRMVGRAEITDKPEVLWEHPEFESLFVRLEDEFEIRGRHQALERKLRIISQTANTMNDLIQNWHTLRLEWYVILLIAAEIGLTLYDLFLKPRP